MIIWLKYPMSRVVGGFEVVGGCKRVKKTPREL